MCLPEDGGRPTSQRNLSTGVFLGPWGPGFLLSSTVRPLVKSVSGVCLTL